MEITCTTSISGYFHKILTKSTLKSWLDNDLLKGNILKLVTILIQIRDIINCEIDLV